MKNIQLEISYLFYDKLRKPFYENTRSKTTDVFLYNKIGLMLIIDLGGLNRNGINNLINLYGITSQK